MPSTLIEVRHKYTPQQQVALIDAVHGALVAAFKIPEEDRFIRVLAYEPHAMVNGLAEGVADSYTRVTIDCFSGRSIDAKRSLYREIVERLEVLGIPKKTFQFSFVRARRRTGAQADVLPATTTSVSTSTSDRPRRAVYAERAQASFG